MIADPALLDGFVECGHVLNFQSFEAEKLINRPGIFAGEKLTAGVCPEVLVGTGGIYRPGRHQCDEHMLVDGQQVFFVVELFEIIAEPVRETCVDAPDGFAEVSER